MTCRRLPCAFFGHGGGPLPLMGQQTEVAATLSSYASTLEAAPSAILIISAHWIADAVSIGSGETHSLLFDYSGFPPETYTYTYPAPGSPDLACRVAELLSAYGVPTRLDPSRGWDHGTFVPLKLMFPHADVPVVALSLHSSLDPDLHINMGRALAPLRSEGVFIIGSGMSFHNFAYFFTRDSAIKALGVQHSYQFNNFLTETLVTGNLSREDQISRMCQWTSAPSAREAHPIRQEEHLIPLHVVFGAADMERDECRLVGSSATDKTTIAVSNFEWRPIK